MMGKSIHFNDCIREIRQSVFGRDNRKPIADAIEEVKSMDYHVSQAVNASTTLIDQRDDSYELAFAVE